MTTIKMTSTTRTTRRRLMAIAAVVTSTLIAVGCELAVDFDRTKIDAGAIDASIVEGGGDTTIPVDGADSGADAVPATDAGVDANDGAVAADADDGAVDANDGAVE